MIIAPESFDAKEFKICKQTIEKAGHQVDVAARYKGEAKSNKEDTYQVTIGIREVKMEEYQGILFIGGSGAAIYLNDDEAHILVRIASDIGQAIGAINIAPSILANAGILSGRKASVFPSEEENMRAKGAELMSSDVTVDGKIVTASGAYAAEEFARHFVEALNK